MDLKILKSWKIWLLLVFLVLAVVAIRPAPWNDGVIIKSVVPESPAAEAGVKNPAPDISPLDHEHIRAVNGIQVESLTDYKNALATVEPNGSLRVRTPQTSYIIDAPANFTEDVLETEEVGLSVAPAPVSNIKKGLDLQGGSRILLKPKEEISDKDFESTMESLKQRLNVYGLGDVVVTKATDLTGNRFIRVEIAGVSQQEVQDLISEQGKFEGKIGNKTAFQGGKDDITYVCRSADCSGINPRNPCTEVSPDEIACNFFFQISLSADAASRHSKLTRNLSVVNRGGQRYLSKPLNLYLDNKQVDSLQISASLKGRETTDIQISGSGTGRTRQEARQKALDEMKSLQTVLITGSLPVELAVAKVDSVSPVLGEKFLNNAILVALAAVLAVSAIISFRYWNFKIALPMIFTMLSEVVLVLGFAALVSWNLDLAAIAGIIVAIGTGVDDIIIITDETLEGDKEILDWKKKLKRAMFIVFGAYFTVVAGMIPLFFAGAGLLKGFAFTTIAGVSFGVLIARPAYADLLEYFAR